MPNINVTLVEGAYSTQERIQLISNLTQAVVDIKGEGVRPFVTVLINQLESGMWGGAGNSVTTEMVKEAIAKGNEDFQAKQVQDSNDQS